MRISEGSSDGGASDLDEHVADDEEREVFRLPGFVKSMLKENRLGVKTGEGFYKKVKTNSGESHIMALRFENMEYVPSERVALPGLPPGTTSLAERLRSLEAGKGMISELFRHISYGLFSYCSHRIPEISDEFSRIYDAMKAGFGWEMGPFEMWDALGVAATAEAMEKAGHSPAPWVSEMLKSGRTYFYDNTPGTNQKQVSKGPEISPDLLRFSGSVWEK